MHMYRFEVLDEEPGDEDEGGGQRYWIISAPLTLFLQKYLDFNYLSFCPTKLETSFSLMPNQPMFNSI